MLALAGYPLGIDFLFLDPAAQPPAASLAPHLHGGFTDRRLLRALARRSEVVTFDWENVSVAALRALHKDVRICPPLAGACGITGSRQREAPVRAPADPNHALARGGIRSRS